MLPAHILPELLAPLAIAVVQTGLAVLTLADDSIAAKVVCAVAVAVVLGKVDMTVFVIVVDWHVVVGTADEEAVADISQGSEVAAAAVAAAIEAVAAAQMSIGAARRNRSQRLGQQEEKTQLDWRFVSCGWVHTVSYSGSDIAMTAVAVQALAAQAEVDVVVLGRAYVTAAVVVGLETGEDSLVGAVDSTKILLGVARMMRVVCQKKHRVQILADS